MKFYVKTFIFVDLLMNVNTYIFSFYEFLINNKCSFDEFSWKYYFCMSKGVNRKGQIKFSLEKSVCFWKYFIIFVKIDPY